MVRQETVSTFPSANALYGGFAAFLPYSYLSGPPVIPPPPVTAVTFGSIAAIGRLDALMYAGARLRASIDIRAREQESTIRII